MIVRAYEDGDWPAVWPIVREVLRTGDTYTEDPGMTEEAARRWWVERPPRRTAVATVDDGVVGTSHMGANRAGPGDHVATASFMVAREARGLGVGSALCTDALAWARARGFAGMQFNAVAATNEAGVEVYRRLGFEIVGTVPGAFRHPTRGRVGLHVMYCSLEGAGP